MNKSLKLIAFVLIIGFSIGLSGCAVDITVKTKCSALITGSATFQSCDRLSVISTTPYALDRYK